MKLMISGHRLQKLSAYDKEWIQITIEEGIRYCKRYVKFFQGDRLIGLSGVADGVDLWFLELLYNQVYNFHVYIPFEGQEDYMSEEDKKLRNKMIEEARIKYYDRNRRMVQDCDRAIIVWDGTKGGTYNCFQMLVEMKKDIYWINPHTKTVNYINNNKEVESII